MHFSKTRPIGRICLEALLVPALWAWGGMAVATSRMGEAEVRMQDGLPCFTITAAEAARAGPVRLQAVAVSDPGAKPVKDLWWLMADPGRPLPISPASCVAYGQAPDGAKGIPAPALQDGRVYEVFINGRPSDAGEATRGYRGRFCLVADGAGGRRALPVAYGRRGGDEAACE